MIGELIMRCFHARTNAHVLHLKTTSYARHKALNDFYDGIVPLVDALAEAYQGDYGLIEDYPSRYTPADDPVRLMTDLAKWIAERRHTFWEADDTHLDNLVDEIVALIRSTSYKLIHLK